MSISSYKNSISGVFFDLFGTLLCYGDMQATWSAWLIALHLELIRAGSTVTIDELAIECQGFFRTQKPTKEYTGFTLYENKLAKIFESEGLNIDSQQIKRVADITTAVWLEDIVLDPDVKPLINELGEVMRLALVTNFDHPPAIKSLLEKHSLGKYFEHVVVSGEVGTRKPNPAIFHITLELLGLPSCEVVHVGDTMEDIEGALSAGIRPVLIIRPNQNTNEQSYDFGIEGDLSTEFTGVRPSTNEIVVISALTELKYLLSI